MRSLPNILSTIRILLTPVFLVLFFEPELWLKILALIIYIIAAITDFFDGYYARKYNIETTVGAFLDPFADKLLTLSGFAVLPFISAEQFPWWAIGMIAFRDVFITLLRVWANRKKLPMATSKLAKTKTTVQMIFLYLGLIIGVFKDATFFLGEWITLLLSTNVMFILLVVVTLFTVYSGIEYVLNNKRLFKSLD
jgi:CDP-diacylglycerol--glycerol-3-phosphate 3-phosphatidyltransferase